MTDPVTLCTGQTYDRCSIEPWLEGGNSTCPCTRQQLISLDLVPNHTLRRLIQEWCVAHGSMGVDRIPTPKVPVDAQTVKSLLYNISQGINRWHSLKILKQLLGESDKNRKCIQDCGALSVLASVLGSIDSPGEQIGTCEESLAMIASFPLNDSKTTTPLLDWKAMTSIAWFQCEGSLEARVNAATILAAIATRTDLQFTLEVSLGVLDSLFKLLREDLYPKAVEASLQALLAISSSRRNLIHVVEVGVIPALIELLPGAEKANAERALGVLALVCTTAEGRAAVGDHALAMAVLVAQIHTVSMLATEHVVSILWYLCKASFKSLVAAQQAGVFFPLLLLLQMDCSPQTRQKGTGLLKHIRSTMEGSGILQHP